MKADYKIIFLDNSVSNIYRTVDALKKEYPGVFVFTNEKELYDFLSSGEPDLLLINLDLLPNDAVTVLKELSHMIKSRPPFVVIYSDKNDDFVQELAFESGADSFIHFHSKPAVMNLFVKNLLRRRELPVTKIPAELFIDSEKYLVYHKGEPVQLPRKEFRLFEILYHSPERFFSKNEIASIIWENESIAGKRTIDVHIYNIRRLLGKRIIQSQKGKGYRINRKPVA